MPRKKKQEEQVPERQATVIESTLEDILADRFNRYSKYIIQERALPDARDGLKPVQRRILWAMWEDGNTFNKPYHKSAKTVGNVIGNYHPHGDSSVYDAIVRMSQEWKIRTPLVDMQGNNGSIDDDPAAAMRYTEARLSNIANYLLEDIDKETVEWAPNFSDEKMEPVVLPARYPNLLVNGITGIAAGYATNIPPHNLDEVLDACIYRIDHPNSSLEQLMQFVKGPDFPTGGIVMGMDGVRQGLKTGRGRCFIRSKTEIVLTKTITQIVVHEIPYEVIKSNLVKRMDELRLNRKIDGLLDVRDESDRNGLRIVLDIKKDANAQAILNYLYKHTDLQISYNYNVTAIVNRTPVVMGLPEILDAFLAHREEVVIKRSQYELAGKKKRAHIVEGLIRAVSILDEIIALIRASKNKADSKQKLMDTYQFTEQQAEAIVMLQLYRLSNTDIAELQAEADSLHLAIQTLTDILEKPEVRHGLMKNELRQMRKEFDVPRRTQLVEEAEELVIDPRAMIANEQVVLCVSRDGYLKRVSMRSYSAAKDSPSGQKEGDIMLGIQACSTLDTLIFFTDRGKFGQIPVFQIQEGKWKDVGSHFSSWMKTEPQEKIVAAWLYHDLPQHMQFVLSTRTGYMKRLPVEELPAFRNRTAGVINLSAGDELAAVAAVYDPDDSIVLATANGKGARYALEDVPKYGPKTRGVRGMKLDEDVVAGLAPASAGSALLFSDQNGLKRIELSDIPQTGRPSSGVNLYTGFKTKNVHATGMLALEHPDQNIIWQDETMKLWQPDTIKIKKLNTAFEQPQQDPYLVIPGIERLHDGQFMEPEAEGTEQLSLFEKTA